MGIVTVPFYFAIVESPYHIGAEYLYRIGICLLDGGGTEISKCTPRRTAPNSPHCEPKLLVEDYELLHITTRFYVTVRLSTAWGTMSSWTMDCSA